VSRRSASDGPPDSGPHGRLPDRASRPSAEEVAEAVELLEQADWSAGDIAELQEFMSCERTTRRADPAFRERLRLELWWLLVLLRLGGDDRLPRA